MFVQKCYLFEPTDEWLMFDDDRVTPVTSEDILKLSGGGKLHYFH